MAYSTLQYTREEIRETMVRALAANSSWLNTNETTGETVADMDRIAEIVLQALEAKAIQFKRGPSHPGYRIPSTGAW
jgi:hypothetical protein